MYEALTPMADQFANVIDEKLYPRCLRYEFRDLNLEYASIETRLQEAKELGHFNDPAAVRPLLLPDDVERATGLYRDARNTHDKRDNFFDDIARAFLSANVKPSAKKQPKGASGSTQESGEGTQTQATLLEIESRLVAKMDELLRSISAEVNSKMATLEEAIENMRRELRWKGTRESEEREKVLGKEVRFSWY